MCSKWKKASARLVVSGMVLASCATPTVMKATPKSTENLLEVASPSPISQTLPMPTRTMLPTKEVADRPTPSPNATPSAHLEREPSLKELASYLHTVFPSGSYTLSSSQWESSYSELTYEDVSGDGKTDLIIRADGEVILTLIYHDVSGDHVGDLIALIPPEVFVLIWTGERYAEPFRLEGEYWWGIPRSRVLLEDWTADGTPEVVFDNDEVTVHGTGIYGDVTTRHLIHCDATRCQHVWQGLLSGYTADHNIGGFARYDADIQLTTNDTGRLTLRHLTEGFSIYCCAFDAPTGYHFSSLHVYTSTLFLYSWSGSAFELTNEQIVSLPYTIKSQASLAATSAAGVDATISAEFNHNPEGGNDICQLFLSGKPIGSLFGCKHNFATVEWKDITGDGLDDIVIIALSGGYPRDKDWNELSDIGCVHRHLIGYRWDGTSAVEIANVEGCVVRKDLYGVRLEDFDGDGQLEILAAGGSIYKWNGTKFVFWDYVPGQ